MGISEFTVHNVLRTYSRQERLGSIHRAKAKGEATPGSADRVTLSPAGQKLQWIGGLAAEMVDRAQPDLTSEDRSARILSTKKQLMDRHREEVARTDVSAETLATRLRVLYLG